MWFIKSQQSSQTVNNSLSNFSAPDQPVHYLLQLHPARGAAGQEDNGARVLVLLHPRAYVPAAPQPRLPRLPGRPMPQPGLLGPVHARHRHPGRQRGHQLRLPQDGRDLPAPHRTLGEVRPPRHRHQPHNVRRPIQPAPH